MSAHPATREADWSLADTQQSIPARFAEQAGRHPTGRAIAGTAWQPTFEELGTAAAAIAHSLRQLNGRGTGRVALLMSHDAPLIAAMLGALSSGQAIVVLNPSDPPGRLERISSRVEASIAIVDSAHSELARLAGFERVLEIETPPPSTAEPVSAVAGRDDLAAVMFTSGSTGRPKGVMHTHHTLLHTALRHSTALALEPGDRVALLASPSGGHGMGTTWMTLLSGATLCPFPVMDRGVAALPGWLTEKRITVLGLSASLFRRLVPALDGAELPDLRLVRLGSEQALGTDFEAWRRHLGSGRFANVFSLTEAGGLAHRLLDSGDEPGDGPLPVGRPAAGVEISLEDENGDAVPAGEIGEIVVRSHHLSPGYWRDESLTSERFTAATGERERALRTGDLGRLDRNGDLVLLGRRDGQLKIRGFRVEPAEVEAALRGLPEVEAAAVRAEPTRHGDPRLVAYVATRADSRPTAGAIRSALGSTLSDASIPTAFAFLDELPLNPHGKVDREALDALPEPTSEPATAAPPASETERELSEIWSAALDLDEVVGRDDDFFDLAGDSLAAAEIGAGIHDLAGVEIDLRAFSTHPTVAQMAELIERRVGNADRNGGEPIRRATREGHLLCTFAQERIWQLREASGYVVVSLTGLDADVDLEALRSAIQHVAAGHEPLRTTFREREGRPVQLIRPPTPVDVPIVEMGASGGSERGVHELLVERAAEPFDLESGPLVRLALLRFDDGGHRLLRVTHHLATDRGSWRIFFRELVPAYEAIRQGRRPSEPDPERLQYADYAAWERERLDPAGPLYRRQVSWWRGTLGDAPEPLRLPFRRPAPASGVDRDEGSLWWGIDPAVSASLDRLGRESGGTRYAVRLAVFSALLSLESGQRDFAIGAYVDTRRHPQTRSMFGYFSNLITLVLPFDPDAGLRPWVAKVRRILSDAVAHSDLPHQLVSEELLASGRIPPEINAIFSLRYSLPRLPFGTAELPTLQSLTAMPWGFSFIVDEDKESSHCAVGFDATLHDPIGVREFVDRYVLLAQLAGAQPDAPLGGLHRELSAAPRPTARRASPTSTRASA